MYRTWIAVLFRNLKLIGYITTKENILKQSKSKYFNIDKQKSGDKTKTILIP